MKISVKLAALALTLTMAGCATHQSPTGRSQMLMHSEAEMAQLGQVSFEQLKQQEKVSRDPARIAYVNCIADRITGVLPAQQWEVVLFDSPQVNAFALPGGYIGVYTGMLNVAQNEDQLAAVMGHEVAHVLARHSNEKVSRSELTGTGLQILNIGLAAYGVESAGTITQLAALGTNVFFTLPYGREQETEADIMGVELMARAGFDPAASVDLWHNMAKASEGAPPEMLSTHPSHSTRINELTAQQQSAQQYYQAAKAMNWPTCSKQK
ncbi:M48 family metallopeptidase [Shewanella corallii]|uniref:M48 family metallopeptidase n=1 Tax=Shewanella corallii TaxID=560080 RepID=A0ABT0N6L7_9GAMM|nr:M48 family metallopeptidase [Shewanella corallii]MCL2913750.1 M48 family metallopeptidase [Shewanella corallii]